MALKYIVLLTCLLLVGFVYRTSYGSSSSQDLNLYDTNREHDLESYTKSVTELHSSDNVKPTVNNIRTRIEHRLYIDILLMSSASLFALCALVAIRDRRKKRYNDEIDWALISKKFS